MSLLSYMVNYLSVEVCLIVSELTIKYTYHINDTLPVYSFADLFKYQLIGSYYENE